MKEENNMSRTPFFYIEVYNDKSGCWEKVNLYTKKRDEFIPIDVWPWNGAHALFSVLDCEDSYDIPDFDAIHYGFPVNASQAMYAKVDEHCRKQEIDGYDYIPEVRYFNLADAKLYLIVHSEVLDSDEMEAYWAMNEDMAWENIPQIKMSNPLKHLVDRVESILDLWDDMWDINRSWSDVRVIYWLNR